MDSDGGVVDATGGITVPQRLICASNDPEHEWLRFIQYARRPLPVTWRVNRSLVYENQQHSACAAVLRRQVKLFTPACSARSNHAA